MIQYPSVQTTRAPWMMATDLRRQPLIALEAFFQRFFVTNTNFQLLTTNYYPLPADR